MRTYERLLCALRYAWRLAMPFWMFRHADRGSPEQRLANYRYNRAHRKILPFYVWKWVGIAVCMLQLTQSFSHAGTLTAAQSTNRLCATLFCMGAGIGFAFSCVVIVVLFACYLYLSCVEK